MTRTAYHRTLLLAALLAALVGSIPAQIATASQWGSPYGDPYGFCAEQSRLPGSYGVVVTNDPSVPTNPERDTFWGWHSNPGYDDWYGYWYGDFRGTPGDDSGWVRLMTVPYGSTGHWNFPDFGWGVHGHAKQYIAYNNWTFAGSCGFGARYQYFPPPYMADVIGTPVTDIYVDSVPPFTPQPVARTLQPGSVEFSWAPVADRGDGAGADYFVSGLDHYSSWLTFDGGPPVQASDTPQPVTLAASGVAPGRRVCAYVAATDRVGNRSPEGTSCVTIPAGPAPTLIVGPVPGAPPVPTLIVGVPVAPPVPTLIVGRVPGAAPPPAQVIAPVPAPQAPPVPAGQPGPPPVPAPPAVGIAANPSPGLVGLASWFWLTPAPSTTTTDQWIAGVHYRIQLRPQSVTWDFGDGTVTWMGIPEGYGLAYPQASTVAHVYQAHSRWGYPVRATVSMRVTWWVELGLGQQDSDDLPDRQQTTTIDHPVQQAQPEVGG